MADIVAAEGYTEPAIQEDSGWSAPQPVEEPGYTAPEPAPDSDFFASMGAATASHVTNAAAAVVGGLHQEPSDEFIQRKTTEIQQREQGLKNFDDAMKQRGFQTPDDDSARAAIVNGLDKAKSELEIYVQPGAPYDPEQDPRKRAANASAEATAGTMREWANQGVWDEYGADPHSANPRAQVGRGLGSMLAVAPAAYAGIPAMAIQGAAEAYGSTYYDTEKKAKDEGLTDPTEIRDRAEKAASMSAVKTAPALGLYMVGGKLTSMAVSRLLPESAPLVKGLFGSAAAAGANVLTGGAIRKLEGGDFAPNIEQLTQDVAWGGFHGLGEYGKAHSELQQKAMDLLSATDTADKLEAAGLTQAAEAVRKNAEARKRYEKPPEEKPPEQTPLGEQPPPVDDNVHAAEDTFLNPPEEKPAPPEAPAAPPAEAPPTEEAPAPAPAPAADKLTPEQYAAESKKFQVFDTKTLPAPKPVEPTPEERAAIKAAYDAAVAKSGFPAVKIADVLEGAGFGAASMETGRGIMADMQRKGEAVLSLGDWSIYDDRTRAWAVPLHGDRYLQVRLLEPSKVPTAEPAPAPAPEARAAPEPAKPAKPAAPAIGPIPVRNVTSDDLPTNGTEASKIRWFHGNKLAKLAADKVSSTFSKIENLFGSGVYLTDSPEVAASYGAKRGKGAGMVHEFGVKVRNILSFEKPLPRDAAKAIRDAAYEDFRPDIDAFLKANPKATGAQFWSFLTDAITEHSRDNSWSSGEYAEMFQGIESNLREAGYDAITHIGGNRVGDGTKQHRVLILLDPRNEYAPANSKNPPTVKKVTPYDPSTRTEPATIERTRRTFSVPFAPLGVRDIIDFIVEQGNIHLPPKGQRKQEHDAAPEKLPGVYQRILSAKGKVSADDMARLLYGNVDESGNPAPLISAPDVEVMWSELSKAVNQRVSVRKGEAEIEKQQRDLQKQADVFDKDARKETKGTKAIHAENLSVGDQVIVKGETLRVTDLDPDTHDVTLEDGKKYGAQLIADGEVIYGEHIEGERSEDFFGDAEQPAEQKAPATYDDAQAQIDAEEERLQKQGVDVYKLYNPDQKGSEILGEQGWKPMPESLRALYRARDEIGQKELQKSVGDITESLKKAGLNPGEIARVLSYYALNRDDAAGQYLAAEHTQKIAGSDPAKQAQAVAIALAAERGEHFDETRDIASKTNQDAIAAVKAVRKYFGHDDQAADQNLPKLRHGEDQGDLLSKQKEDLTLVGEKGVDWAKREQEKEQAARDKAEAEEIARKQQRTMFQAEEGANLTPAQEQAPQMTKPDGTPFWSQRERAHREIDGVEGLNDDQRAGIKALLDARAGVWAKEHGKTVNDYYAQIAFRTVDAKPGEIGAKGKVTFFESGLKLVTAFRDAADVSTLAHEIGHIFRDEMNAEQRAVAEKWAGVKDGKWNEAAEEKFARAFERYLMEGKAPTPELKPIFERFKDWMTRIYEGLHDFLVRDGSLSPAISDVFDSLLTGETMRSKGYVGFESKFPEMAREHAELFQGFRDVLKELRDIPRFTAFKKAINQMSYRMQRTFLESHDIIAKTKEAIPDPVRRRAIGVYIEARAEADRTGETHQEVLDRWAATNQARKYQSKYDAARALTPEEQAFAGRVDTFFRNKLGVAQSWGILDQGLEGYVRRIWKQPSEKQQAVMSAARLKTSAGFQKHRFYETAFEGEQPKVHPTTGASVPGLEHLTDDIGEQMALYSLELNKVIAQRELIQSLSQITGADGRPAVYPRGGKGWHDPSNPTPPDHYLVYPRKMGDVMNQISGEREATFDFREIKNQRLLTRWKWMGEDEMGNPILLNADLMVHPDFHVHVDRITKGSALTEWAHSPGSAVQGIFKGLFRIGSKAQAIAKEAMFSLSGFHYATIAEHVAEHRVNPFPEIGKSILNVATRVVPPLHRMVSRSLRLKMVDYNDPATADWMRHSLMLAADRTSAAHFMEGVGGQTLLRRIPFIGKIAGTISDDLFHRFIPALKLRMVQAIHQRNMSLYRDDLAAGKVTVSDVKYLSAKQVNAATSHLNSIDLADSFLHDPTFRHIMSLTVLAPDFTESRARFLGQGAKGLISRNGREQLMALAIGGGILYATMRVVNSMLNDRDPKWEPKYAFSIVHGNRVYQVRSVQGDVIHATTNWQGFAQGRLAPVARFAFQAGISGVNYRGEKVSAIDSLGELMGSYIPISLRELPGLRDLTATQKNTPVSPWEQFAGTMGVHTSRFSPITETYQNARDWNVKQGQPADKGVYPVSKYQQLRYALEDGDMDRAKVEYKKLLDAGMARDKVAKGFKQSIDHPFTGTNAGDAQFERSLEGRDKDVFKEAKRTRERILMRFGRL